MRRNRTDSDHKPPVYPGPFRTSPVHTPPESSNDLPPQAARTDAPLVSEPRVLHHPNEVTALLDNEDLSSCRLALRLDTPLDTATCRELTQLLERADVHLAELSLTPSDTLDADALAALLAAAEAHRDSLSPAGFRLQNTGVPLPDSLRVVVAGSRLCLELSAPTVRPLLFGHHLRPREEWVNANDGTQYALQDFLQCKLSLFDSEHEVMESLSQLAQKTNDFALMRACSVLSPGSQIRLSALPETPLGKFLLHWKIPYRLDLHLWSEPQVDALARWLRDPRPLFQGISLRGFPEVDYWELIFARLVTQPDLQGVCISLSPNDRLPFLPMASEPTERRLPHLMFWSGDDPFSDASKNHVRFVADLTRYLNPGHVVLRMYTQTNIEHVIDQLSQGSSNPLGRLMGLHIGWTTDKLNPASGKGLKRMFSQITANGMMCLDSDPPDSDSAWWGLAERRSGKRLYVSLRPGPTYGLSDRTKLKSTLRFHRTDYLHGAAAAMLQELLRQNDHHHGLGEDSLARQLIKESSFSPRDLNALARVSWATHRGGQAAHIVWVMHNLPEDAPALRKWFKLPSGALDDDLVNAVRTQLKRMHTPEPMWDLFLEATAPQSV